MKNLINIIYKAALCLIFTLLTTYAFSQIPLCDTCKYTMELEKYPDILDSIVPDPPTLNVTEFDGCPDGYDDDRNITFIHGLGGNSSSWGHQARWTDGYYKADEVQVNYEPYTQSDFHSVAGEINIDIWTGTGSGADDANANRCKLNDFAIAHSQGGIAARYLDWEWDRENSNFGRRKFYGLVTFGVPHAGAHVALTRKEHPIFVSKVVSSIFLEGSYDLVGLIPQAYNIVNNTEQFMSNNLAPIMLADMHTNTLNEMAPNTDTINLINNHQSRLRKVAFYGVEQAPECWRIIDNIATKSVESYPAFKAKPDTVFRDRVEVVRAEHLSKIEEEYTDLKKTKTLATFLPATFEAKRRLEAIRFLNNANTYWRFLIGSYHKDSMERQLVTKYKVSWMVKYGFLGRWFSGERVFYSEVEARDWMKIYPLTKYKVKDMKIEKCLEYQNGRKLFPSDGVVLTKSQTAFPGVDPNHIWRMNGDNHFQMRNSPNTETALVDLYSGKYGLYFKTQKIK